MFGVVLLYMPQIVFESVKPLLELFGVSEVLVEFSCKLSEMF